MKKIILILGFYFISDLDSILLYEPKTTHACGWPGQIQYGTVHLENINALYQCHKSYELIGLTLRICNIKTGIWNGPIPYCVNNLIYAANETTTSTNSNIFLFKNDSIMSFTQNLDTPLPLLRAYIRYHQIPLFPYLPYIYSNCIQCIPELHDRNPINQHMHFICTFHNYTIFTNCFVLVRTYNNTLTKLNNLLKQFTLYIANNVTCAAPDLPRNCKMHPLNAPNEFLLEPESQFQLHSNVHFEPPLVICRYGVWYPDEMFPCVPANNTIPSFFPNYQVLNRIEIVVVLISLCILGLFIIIIMKWKFCINRIRCNSTSINSQTQNPNLNTQGEPQYIVQFEARAPNTIGTPPPSYHP